MPNCLEPDCLEPDCLARKKNCKRICDFGINLYLPILGSPGRWYADCPEPGKI